MVQSLGLQHHKHQPGQGGPKEEAGWVSSVWQQMVTQASVPQSHDPLLGLLSPIAHLCSQASPQHPFSSEKNI